MSIELDLLTLADYTQPNSIVDEIFRQNPNIVFPIDLEKIAEMSGIEDIQYHSLSSVEGLLVANEEKSHGIIAINNDAIPTRQRYTLGHEIGHFLIPTHGHVMKCTTKDLQKNQTSPSRVRDIEAEANQFSSLLLMPETLIKKRGWLSAEPCVEDILHLKDKCNVSLQASANNYINFHDDHLAIIYTHKDKINYGLNSESNPLWLVADKKTQVPKHSQINTINLDKRGATFFNEVDTSVWFKASPNKPFPKTVLEETYVQEKGWAATLLRVVF